MNNLRKHSRGAKGSEYIARFCWEDNAWSKQVNLHDRVAGP